jgi:branched-chain amino acid aminotransferase
MLNQEGYVAETSTENIFVVKKNEVITPPQTSGILKGVTRDVLIEVAKELGYEVNERDLTIHELYTADEVFVTGTAAEMASITEISGRVIGDGEIGEVSRRIRGRFREKTKDPKEGVGVD